MSRLSPRSHPQLALLALFLAHASAPAEPLRAGAARIDVTPPTGFPMWGYAARKAEPSVGVRDPLHARAVVLEVGKDTMALVALDLGRAPPRKSMVTIRKLVKEATGIDTLFIVASHTHHGPILETDTWPTKEKSYLRELEEKLARVIIDAHKKLEPAALGITAAEVAYNRNRHSKRPDRPVDKEAIVVRLDNAAGKPIAHLVNFAAHPTMLPAKLREFSADFPGPMCKHVEKELGGVCLFLQGAAGDLSPNPSGRASPEDFGAEVGTWVVERSRDLKNLAKEMGPMKTRERDFKFASRIELNNPLIYAAYSMAFFPALVDFYRDEYREGIRPHLTTALLGNKIGIVGVSGEFFSSHAIHLKRRARLGHLLFLGYCNDYHQYFPTIEAIAEGGYGADSTVSPAEIGAGERIMDRALLDLYELQGKLRPPAP